MPIKVGDKKVNQNVYVFQLKLPYNLLLGRPWIHKIRITTSMLDPSIKFMYKGYHVTIYA